MAINATPENFNDAVNAPLVFVDFWAPWCGPCKMMEPVLDQLEEDFGKKIKFVKFNVDQNQEIPQKYKVMSMPSFVVFRNGKGVEKVTGLYSKDKLAHFLNRKLEEK
ncbi:thioredoxin [Lactobacillus sp. S2-2]|uniref:thioredoxin n=1 Tax=Lactobacillus sp. S2-2 TaxID=2692917 RepID=UPI001F01EB07|nr:thioredoxin [Lactobacillus sp. S2-2]MCF6515256.1 thioredoxin [Lactobacillus sp. S2-2]